MGLITLLTKAFCSCHYLGFAPVHYSVNFSERLSRAAKGILLCQMLHLLLSLYPGKHLSLVAALLPCKRYQIQAQRSLRRSC